MSTAETIYFRCIPDLVSYDRDLPYPAPHLFVMIAHEAYLDTGKAQVTVEHLADVSGMSVRSVLRYTPLLEEKGYIRVHRAPKGSKIPNIYEITGVVSKIVVRGGKTEGGRLPNGHSTP